MGYTVLSVAYPLTEVGEDAVGGSEQVLTALDRALTAEGHRSIVIAAKGSKVRGTLVSSPVASGLIDAPLRRKSQETHARLISEVLNTYSVDLIHLHSLDFHCYLPDPGTPALATLHLPAEWYPPHIFQYRRPDLYLNCVSAAQERTCPPSHLLLPHIPNGVDVVRLGGRTPKRNFALALGRICPEKGFHFALDAAKQADIDLLVGGEVHPYAAHEEYFQSEIVPRLDKRRRFVGKLDFKAKRRLLLEARCLLIPSTVQETSSLVAMEALAAGTPVIAFPSGALPEIIEDGITGYLVNDSHRMAQAIDRVSQLDPEACRREARRRFSAARMVERYLETYTNIIARKTAALEEPRKMSATSWLVSW